MKKLIVLLILVLAVSVNAADLKWGAALNSTGTNIYFTDGVETFNYDAGSATEIVDIDDALNLHPGTTYTFTAKGYSSVGESIASNSVDYITQDAYIPPINSIPVRVERPSIITIIVE